VGVITDRDVTRSVADTQCTELTARDIMTREAITVQPDARIIDCVGLLETNEISAVPVLEGERVVGMISGDLLARRTLFRLLQTQTRDGLAGVRESKAPPPQA